MVLLVICIGLCSLVAIINFGPSLSGTTNNQSQVGGTPTDTPAPSPTPTLVHQITDIVTHHKSDDGYSKLHGVLTGAACDSAGICHVDDTEPDAFERKDDIQVDCYAIFDALYNSKLNIQQLTINIFGNVVDKYGNSHKAVIARAMLTKQTEEKFNWKGLEFWTAWEVYDQTEYLVGGL